MLINGLRLAGMACPVAAVVAALSLAAPRTASAQMASAMTVRLYDASRLPSATLAAARHVVDDVFSDAGVRVTWRMCDGRRGACDEAPAPEEIVLRLMKPPPSLRRDPRRLPLGESVLAPPWEPSTFASVYPDRVRHLANRAGVALAEPLGHAIAHELTHLLLRSRAHATDGLMREHWTAGEVARRRRGDWQLRMEDRSRVAAAGRERAAMREAGSRLAPAATQ